MGNVPNNVAARRTRQSLVEAAGKVFAEVGLERATVREITRRAGVNGAAVNYHFTDKAELYAAAVRAALDDPSGDAGPPSPDDGPADAALAAWVAAMLDWEAGVGRAGWKGRLLARELSEPTSAADLIADEYARPNADDFGRLVERVIGRPPTRRELATAWCAAIGLCGFVAEGRAVVARVFGDEAASDDWAGRIAAFLIGGLRGQTERGAP